MIPINLRKTVVYSSNVEVNNFTSCDVSLEGTTLRVVFEVDEDELDWEEEDTEIEVN
jgi:hypothetical protein